MMPRGISRALSIAIVWSLSVTLLQADYKASFRRGIQAINQRQWAEAVRQLKAALAEQPTETGERIVISGMDTRPYFPYYYLGLALMNASDCPAALAAWQTSETQGRIKTSTEYGQLTRLRGDCQAKVARSSPPVTPPVSRGRSDPPAAPSGTPAGPPAGAPPAPRPAPTPLPADDVGAARASLAGARQADGRVATVETEITALQVKAWAESDLAPAQARARLTMQSASTKLDAAVTQIDPASLREATDLAKAAAQEFDALLARATSRRDELRRAAAEAAKPAPPPTGNNANPGGAVGGVGNNAPARDKPPAGLVTAAAQLFQAHYQLALNSLATANYPGAPATAQVHLLRAAARYSLFLSGSPRDMKLKQDAEHDVRLCKQTDPKTQPDPRFFTPRFVEFFRTTR